MLADNLEERSFAFLRCDECVNEKESLKVIYGNRLQEEPRSRYQQKSRFAKIGVRLRELLDRWRSTNADRRHEPRHDQTGSTSQPAVLTGSDREEISSARVKFDGFPGDVGSRISQSCENIVTIKRWQLGHDLLGGHPIGQHPENRCNGDSKSPDARHPTHLAGVHGDAVHAVNLPNGCHN